MKDKSQVQIFLAHASEDKEEIINLYNQLKTYGYNPWLDKKNLMPGQNWRNEIPNAIRHSDIVIACLSTRSVSKQGYVQREFKMALNQYADRPPGSIYIIPLRLDDCQIPDLRQDEYGVNLRDIHWLDYWEENSFETLLKAIEYARKKSQTNTSSPANQTEDIIKQVEETKTVTVNRQGNIISRENLKANYFTENINAVFLEMVYIPGGTFMMGTDDGEIERLCAKYNNNNWLNCFRNEQPRHEVTVPPFFMGKYPVTQKQWQAIAVLDKVKIDLNPNPSYFKGDNRPVEQVNWYELVEFCQRLSRETGKNYRLPSEAQWEYAARGQKAKGKRQKDDFPFCFGETITGELANYDARVTYADEPPGKYREETTPVGQFPPNAFGLYDMHGNVWEWCADDWHDNYKGAPTDGSAWIDNNSANLNKVNNPYSVLRGGSWGNDSSYCRSAFRYRSLRREYRVDDFGFRVVCACNY